MESPPLGLGTHWLFDGQGVPAARLDEASLRRVLDELPELLGLRKVCAPQTFHHAGQGQRTVAGIVLLAESHLSLHAFPAQGLLHGDLFSCKPFDAVAARRYLHELFTPEYFREQHLERRAPTPGHLGQPLDGGARPGLPRAE
ncbi:S-adenosylmethionine decarboxylase [Myxococcaceae bacterium GXIMD 01537]